MSNTYYQDALVQVNVSLTNVATGILTDPTTLTLSIGTGNEGMTTKYTYGVGGVIQRTSTGVYYANIDTTSFVVPADWFYVWVGTGTAQAVGVGHFKLLARPTG